MPRRPNTAKLDDDAHKAADHELDEGFNLMALRANATNDNTLRPPRFVDVQSRIESD